MKKWFNFCVITLLMSFAEISQHNWEREMDGHMYMHICGIWKPLSLRKAKNINEFSLKSSLLKTAKDCHHYFIQVKAKH